MNKTYIGDTFSEIILLKTSSYSKTFQSLMKGASQITPRPLVSIV